MHIMYLQRTNKEESRYFFCRDYLPCSEEHLLEEIVSPVEKERSRRERKQTDFYKCAIGPK